MPLCRVCASPHRTAIDADLVKHQTGVRNVAKRYGLTASSVYRHATGHLPAALKEAKVKMDSDSLARSIRALNSYVARVLKRGEAAGDDRLVLLAVGEGRRNTESLAKLGVLSDVEKRLALLEAGKEVDADADDPDGDGAA